MSRCIFCTFITSALEDNRNRKCFEWTIRISRKILYVGRIRTNLFYFRAHQHSCLRKMRLGECRIHIGQLSLITTHCWKNEERSSKSWIIGLKIINFMNVHTYVRIRRCGNRHVNLQKIKKIIFTKSTTRDVLIDCLKSEFLNGE